MYLLKELKYLSKLTFVQETIFRPTKHIFDPFHLPMSVSPGDALISLSSSSSSSLFSFHPFAGKKGGEGSRWRGEREAEKKIQTTNKRKWEDVGRETMCSRLMRTTLGEKANGI